MFNKLMFHFEPSWTQYFFPKLFSNAVFSFIKVNFGMKLMQFRVTYDSPFLLSYHFQLFSPSIFFIHFIFIHSSFTHSASHHQKSERKKIWSKIIMATLDANYLKLSKNIPFISLNVSKNMWFLSISPFLLILSLPCLPPAPTPPPSSFFLLRLLWQLNWICRLVALEAHFSLNFIRMGKVTRDFKLIPANEYTCTLWITRFSLEFL